MENNVTKTRISLLDSIDLQPKNDQFMFEAIDLRAVALLASSIAGHIQG